MPVLVSVRDTLDTCRSLDQAETDSFKILRTFSSATTSNLAQSKFTKWSSIPSI